MKKLENSIRHELVSYGPALRNGHWGAQRHTVGAVPDDFRFLARAYYDYDPTTGIVTDIRMYAVGDAMTAEDRRSPYEITEPLENYLSGCTNWDGLINEIAQTVIAQQDTPKAEEI